MADFFERSLIVHEQLRGKIALHNKAPVKSRDDLSLAYTPGVARPCEVIAADPSRTRDLTVQGNSVGVVSDGSAVLGLGNIGPRAAIPVMEGKALLFKEFAGIDAWPICLDTQNVDEIITTVRHIAPVLAALTWKIFLPHVALKLKTRSKIWVFPSSMMINMARQLSCWPQ